MSDEPHAVVVLTARMRNVAAVTVYPNRRLAERAAHDLEALVRNDGRVVRVVPAEVQAPPVIWLVGQPSENIGAWYVRLACPNEAVARVWAERLSGDEYAGQYDVRQVDWAGGPDSIQPQRIWWVRLELYRRDAHAAPEIVVWPGLDDIFFPAEIQAMLEEHGAVTLPFAVAKGASGSGCPEAIIGFSARNREEAEAVARAKAREYVEQWKDRHQRSEGSAPNEPR